MRVRIVVEGRTEATFVDHVLAPALWPCVYLTPILLGVPGHKGGRVNYARVRRDLLLHLKQERDACCTTMLDFFRLGEGFPGVPQDPNLTSKTQAEAIEAAIRRDICSEIPDRRPDVRFLPYLQLHEFEALLFSDPHALAAGIRQPHLAGQLAGIRAAFATPEDIDDGPETAPSKRLLQAYPGYRKVLDGTLAAQQVGLQAMREQCPRFRAWVEWLASLGN